MANYNAVMSSGHAKYVSGAVGYLNEVNEARRVVERVAALAKAKGGSIGVYHDNTSKTQSANIGSIVANHKAHSRKLDVSVHFNAFKTTSSAMGVEVLYKNDSQKANAAKLSAAIAKVSGLKNRGAKKRTNLGFLNSLSNSLLIEICFVDSSVDAKIYRDKFESICKAISDFVLSATGVPVKATASAKPTVATKPATSGKTTYYRVKTGTYPTKTQAQTAADMIKRLKIASVAHVVASGSQFYIKTGQYKTKADATNAMNKIKSNKIAWVLNVVSE